MIARALGAFLIGLTALLPTEAAALSLSPGAEIILNWDLTGATPALPYAYVEIDLVFQSLILDSPSQGIGVTVYSDLNGGGSVLVSTGAISIGPDPSTIETLVKVFTSPGCCPTLFDGLFSVGLTVTREGTEVLATAMGTVETGASTSAVPGVVVPGVVPEPASFALLATGLGAAWFARRLRR